MKRARRFLAPTIIGIAVAGLMLLSSGTDFVRRFELRLLDYRFVLRDEFPMTPVPLSKDIVLVSIDLKTIDALKEPMPLWLPHYGRAFKGIFEGGATVIGLDTVVKYADDAALAKFGQAVLPYTDRLVLIGFLETDDLTGEDRLVKPVDPLVALIGAQNVALANLTRDADGIPRAQQIFPFGVPDSANPSWSPFSARLAEKHTGRRIDLERRTFGKAPLPLLPDGRLLINYTGAQPTFPHVSLSDVLARADRKDTAWLRENFGGKVVLVGPGSRVFQDISETPFNAGGGGSRTMLGMEVQANILNTLLTGAWLTQVTSTQNALFLILICLVTAFLAGRLSAVPGVLVSALLMFVVFFVGYIEFARYHAWIDLASPLAAIPLVWGGSYAYRHLVEEKARRAAEERTRYIRDTFGKYVSNEVMEELLRDPEKLKLGGERRETTVFFSDINGFTTTCETRSPEEVLKMLNEYFDEMTKIVFKHGGTLEQFVGDEIMVLFGVPQKHPAPTYAAVNLAVEMVERLEELRRLDPEEKNGFYRIKIGIHTGRPIVGNIGTTDRRQYTALGDMVNLASRIMNMTKEVGGTILISETTYDLVRDLQKVEFIDHGHRAVRGRQDTVRVYEVRSKKSEEVHAVASSSTI